MALIQMVRKDSKTVQIDDLPTAASTAGIAQAPLLPERANSTDVALLLEAITSVGRWAISETDPIELMKRATLLSAKLLRMDHLGIAQFSAKKESSTIQFGSVEQYEQSQPLEQIRLDPGTLQSLYGYAISQAAPVFVANLEEQNEYDDRYLRDHGIVRAMVAPLRDLNTSYGLIGVYSTQPRSFNKFEVAFLESIAHLVTTIIARNRALNSLAREKQFSKALMESTDALLLMLTPEGNVAGFNRALKELSGFELSEILNRHFTNVFSVSSEVPLFKQHLDALREGNDPVRFESGLLTKHGDFRKAAWSFTSIREQDGAIESIVCTAIDITDKCAALERAKVAEATAEAVKRSLLAVQDQVRNGKTDGLESILAEILVGDEETSETSESKVEQRSRRQHIRCPFRHKQQCGLVIDGKLPRISDFFEVVCNDISAGGISLLVDERPPTDELIVVLGAKPSVTYMKVSIRHVRKTEHEGREMYLLGCCYLQRVTLPE